MSVKGFGLLGIMLTLAVSAGIIATVFTIYGADVNASQAAETGALATRIRENVQRAYAASPDYLMLNNTSALREGLIPATTLHGGQPLTPWGGAIQVAGMTNGYALTYEQVPTGSCAPLVANAARGWDDVTIDGVSVMVARHVSTQGLALACEHDGSTIQFVKSHRDAPALTACVPLPDETRTVACPSGQASTIPPYGPNGITETRQSVCVDAYSAPVYGAWQMTANTCG